jgi:RNA polymerase sigma factor (sigma-70 family)
MNLLRAQSTFECAYPHAWRAASIHTTKSLTKHQQLVCDREDILQDVMLGLWREIPNFDPRKSSLPTFVERVVKSRTSSAIRDRRTLKRTTMAPLTSEPVSECASSKFHLRADVERLLAHLTPFDRLVAEELIERTPTEAARALGVSRSTLYLAIERIRAVFVAGGLYLDRNS